MVGAVKTSGTIELRHVAVLCTGCSFVQRGHGQPQTAGPEIGIHGHGRPNGTGGKLALLVAVKHAMHGTSLRLGDSICTNGQVTK